MLLVICAAVLGSFAPAEAASPACGGLFRFEPKEGLRVTEIASLIKGRWITASGDRSMRVAEFDSTARPVRGKWTGLALVTASQGLGGDPAIGGVLWTSAPERFGANPVGVERRQRDQVVLTFRPSGQSCPEGFTFVLKHEGEFFADGARLGSIRW